MTTYPPSGVRCAILAALLALVLPGAAAAQESRSAPLVKELTRLLDAAKLDAFAAKDTSEPDRYVAALYFPGVQLLVVSARYQAPVLLDEKIGQRNHRDVYIDLGSAAIRDTKDFIQDLGTDGLAPRREEGHAFDIATLGSTEVAFDGDHKRQKLTPEEYQKAFAAADEKYARMVSVLLAAARKQAS
jgi:hypothetical protein